MTVFEECLKNIAEAYLTSMPEKLEKMLTRIEFWGTSIRSYGYIKLADESAYRHHAHITRDFGISDKEYDKVDDVVYHQLKIYRAACIEEGLESWDGVTIMLAPNGEIKCDFDCFDQVSTELGSSRDAWEAKYLV